VSADRRAKQAKALQGMAPGLLEARRLPMQNRRTRATGDRWPPKQARGWREVEAVIYYANHSV